MLFPVPSPQDETVPNGEAELGKQTCGTWAIQNYEPVSPEAAEEHLPRALWCSITFQATASITLRRNSQLHEAAPLSAAVSPQCSWLRSFIPKYWFERKSSVNTN